MSERRNWAGNYTYEAPRVHSPETLEQLQTTVASYAKLKALGTRHSFNDIADTDGEQVSTERLNKILALDRDAKTVTVQGGTRYGELCLFLSEQGFALANLASLPHISVAGACATGTHGSGLGVGSLSSAVHSLTLVTASGEAVHFSRQDDRFPGTVVSLGALGVVAELTLDVEPAYEMEQRVYQDLPFDALPSHFLEIEQLGYSVSLFTNWSGDHIKQVWVKRRVSDANPPAPRDLFGATAATRKLHPIGELSAIHCTEQLGVPGPWFERLPHFRLGFTPSSGEELQTEFLVAQSDALAAFAAIRELGPKISPLLLISEVRTVAADNLWMSPSYGRDSVAIHLTWKQLWPEVRALIPEIEAALEPFAARPHWGKLFTMGRGRIATLYEKLPEFNALADDLDPAGKFRNRFLEEKVFG